ncbi:hypothetical protein HKBW3C_00631 [Candidatus Hakubella thermalkaliphila]|nr:hypothetical protein HKBW3C_00631 [Candidatus Hakubella thermalkaliphila]
MVNSFHIDFQLLLKQVNKSDVLGIVAGGDKKPRDGKVIEIGKPIAFGNAVHWHTSWIKNPQIVPMYSKILRGSQTK